MRKYFVSCGFADAMIAASLVTSAGTGQGSTSASRGTSSSGRVPTFTLDQAILTALQRNPDILRAEQEIKRTKGVIIEIRAQALPHITPTGTFEWTDPNLVGARVLGGTTGTSTTHGTATTTGAALLVDAPPSQDKEPTAAALDDP